MFHFEVGKYAYGDITVKSGFTDIGFEKVFTFDFTENGTRGNFIFNDAIFYIVDERIIVAEFNIGTFGSHIEFIFVVSFISAVSSDEFIMFFAVHIGIVIFFMEIFAAFDFLIDSGKRKIEDISNGFNFNMFSQAIL